MWPFARKKAADPRTGIRSSVYYACQKCGTGGDKFTGYKWDDDKWHTVMFCEHSDTDPCSGSGAVCVWCWDELGTNEARFPYYVKSMVEHMIQGMAHEEFLVKVAALARAMF